MADESSSPSVIARVEGGELNISFDATGSRAQAFGVEVRDHF